MKKLKIKFIYSLIILIFIMLISSCAKQTPQKPTPKSDEPKQMPPVVEEMESEIISIMSAVDMIPYYKKQIEEKKKKDQEKKEFSKELAMGSQEGGNKGADEGSQGGASKNQMSQIESMIKFEPKPITINDILLSDILKAEATDKKDSSGQKIPNDIAFMWHEINTKIGGLHKKWNSLESEVIKSGTSQESISGFENTLNNLTISSSQYNFIDTLFYSNKLTLYIPDLIKNFKKKVPSPIYYMKYHLRQIVLDCRIKDYTKASNNYNKLSIYKDAIVSQLIDKKLSPLANKLNTSIKDLENALMLKDLNIIKIKASVVMSNIESVKEELSK